MEQRRRGGPSILYLRGQNRGGPLGYGPRAVPGPMFNGLDSWRALKLGIELGLVGFGGGYWRGRGGGGGGVVLWG